MDQEVRHLLILHQRHHVQYRGHHHFTIAVKAAMALIALNDLDPMSHQIIVVESCDPT